MKYFDKKKITTKEIDLKHRQMQTYGLYEKMAR
jgi:hypothetical protein